MISAVLVVLAAISFFTVWIWPRRSHRLPPGPFPWPVIGNLLSMEKFAYLTLSKWTKIYGNIFKVKFFHQEMVIISDAKLARKAFNKWDLSGRPNFAVLDISLEGKDQVSAGDSVATAEGKRWTERRRFTMKHLRGFTKDRLYPLLVNEITGLLDWAKTQEGKPVELTPKIGTATINVLWILLCGERLVTDDVMEEALSQMLQTILASYDNPLITFFPTAAKLFGPWSGWSKFTSKMYRLHDILRPAVTRRLEKYADMPSVDEPLDFLDNMIQTIKEIKDETSSLFHAYNSINVIVRDIVLGGAVNIRATTQWGILYLSTFPEIQRKLQKEIDDQVGRHVPITIDDVPRLPYAQAVVREILRKTPVAPLGLAHRAMEDVEFQGFIIPKGMMVAINIYHVHHDPKVWGDPENFRLERFLTVNTEGMTMLQNYDEFMPFSIGRRQCVGEQFAKEEALLFLTNLFQNFDISFAPGVTPNLESKTLTQRVPHVHQVILTNRS